MKHDTPLADACSELGLPLSGRQAELLLEFERLLRDRAVPAGFVAEGDLPRLRERHILDCLRAATLVGPTDRSAYDLGSGAGLPGIPVAIAHPTLALTLVERRQRRAAFLELAVERLGLPNVKVVAKEISGVEGQVDLCFARALAPLPETWLLAEPLLRPGGRLVYFAGEGVTGAGDVAAGRATDIRTWAVLERSGPLVIIAR